MRTRLKICGLKQADDVLACVEAGADAVGFVFYEPSPRYVGVADAAELCVYLKPWVTPVALFVNPSVELVNSAIEAIPNLLLQFHGDESKEFCERFSRPYIKAIRMQEATNLRDIGLEYSSAQALLLDSWSTGYGGSGHAFDWKALANQALPNQPIILSGGLTSELVFKAISEVRPYGLDVSSGVERSRGVKCRQRIVEFCHSVQLANASLINGEVKE